MIHFSRNHIPWRPCIHGHLIRKDKEEGKEKDASVSKESVETSFEHSLASVPKRGVMPVDSGVDDSNFSTSSIDSLLVKLRNRSSGQRGERMRKDRRVRTHLVDASHLMGRAKQKRTRVRKRRS